MVDGSLLVWMCRRRRWSTIDGWRFKRRLVPKLAQFGGVSVSKEGCVHRPRKTVGHRLGGMGFRLGKLRKSFSTPSRPSIITTTRKFDKMPNTSLASPSLPVLPAGWAAEKDFKPIGKVTASTQRSIEPVGPHFLAHARRARHKRTFSEDDRIQAQERAKNVEDEDAGEISEPEDPMMLQREARDWKV